MAHPKTKEERLTLEEKAWDLRCRGRSVRQIAAVLGVAPGTAHRMVQRVANRYHERIAGQVAAHRAEVAEQLDWIIEEASGAWERSKAAARRNQRRTKSAAPTDREGAATGGDLAAVEQVETVTQTFREGDPQYLKRMLEALAEKRRLLGLDVQPDRAGAEVVVKVYAGHDMSSLV